ncbi:hypothetical protein ACDT12_13070 [Staphylococcus aureus]
MSCIPSTNPLKTILSIDQRGQLIEQLIQERNLVVLNDGSGTHLTQSGSRTPIDATIVSPRIAVKSTWEVTEDNLGSDRSFHRQNPSRRLSHERRACNPSSKYQKD